MAQNYASQYSSKVAERFSRESFIADAVSNSYKFTGVKSITVYSINTVDLVDYNRTKDALKTGSRYGDISNLDSTIQTMTISKDRAFTFSIDKGDKLQSQMVYDAGRALTRELREKVVPEFDKYVFEKIARGAGESSATTPTKDNAYETFLTAQETLSNANVPDTGRICFCSYGFYNLLHLDNTFTLNSDVGQRQQLHGEIGEIDGCRIIRVPSSRLPSTTGASAANTSFILIHPGAVLAPKQLEEFKIHDNPQGISGWLIEGRVIYDAFVLDAQKDSIYYQGPALS